MPAGKGRENISRMINEYGDSVLRMCCVLLKDYHLAEDVAQETFIQVMDKYETLEDPASEKAWIMKIAVNRCKNEMRRRWFKRESLDSFPELSGKDPYEHVDNNDRIFRAIKQLPTKYKEVILLYYYQELSAAEIGTILNINETAVLQRLKRGREKLKKEMEEADE